MKEDIYKKLNDIEELSDRQLMKKILNGLFSELEEYSREKHELLENRVFDELEYSQEKYNLYCSVERKDKVDITNEFLHPMVDKDLEEEIYDTQEILDKLAKKEDIEMFNVFLECDYIIYQKLVGQNLEFKGTIETDKRTYEAYFTLSENKVYWEKVIELYKGFINNNIPWETINNPYISKIARIILKDCEEGITKDETISKISVDFGEYTKYVKYNMVPMWNVKKLALKANGFPMPCEDKINYEHSISLQREGMNHGYIVEYNSDKVEYVTRKNDYLIITSSMEVAQVWNVWKIISNEKSKFETYSYELMSNARKSSFIGRLAAAKNSTVKTKAELTRVINSFEVSKHLEFQYLKLEDLDTNRENETYDMNYFIFDEIREANLTKCLSVYFKVVDRKDYLIYDILSFIVSEIQLLYPEYKCEGRLL